MMTVLGLPIAGLQAAMGSNSSCGAALGLCEAQNLAKGLSKTLLMQVEQELAEERAAAEIEAQRAQEAIQAKQQELQRIEQQRQYEVCSHHYLPC